MKELFNLSNIINEQITFSNIEYNNTINRIKIVEIDKDIKKYETLIKEVIEYYKNNYITKDDFENYNTSYIYELNNLKLEKEKIENNLNNKINLNWLYKLRDLEKIERLNKKIIDEFIDNIFINEERKIKVVFKYNNQYEDLIKYLKLQKCMI